jgi:hypothetical protein
MNDLRAAAQQALEALEAIDEDPHGTHSFPALSNDAITALRAALAQQQEQEPVAWQVHPFDYGIGFEGVYAMTQLTQQRDSWIRKGWKVTPLYTHPPRREWQSLTEEEHLRIIDDTLEGGSTLDVARAIEQACKERNT